MDDACRLRRALTADVRLSTASEGIDSVADMLSGHQLLLMLENLTWSIREACGPPGEPLSGLPWARKSLCDHKWSFARP